MSITSPITEEHLHDLDKALEPVRDRDDMRRAIEALKKSQEETRKRIGTVTVAVDLIRDARDQ